MYLNNSKQIVIKIGSSLLIDENKNIRKKWLLDFAKDIEQLIKSKKKVIIVSSGAIALGCKKLKLNKIKVNTHIEEEKTLLLNKFFFESIKSLTPYTKVKMAISRDEKIAWSNYKSKWISNAQSRNYAHKIRLKSH